MTDSYTISEESYKNGFKDGFERGYVAGKCGDFAEATSGAIEWHEDEPEEDQPYCYICVKSGERKYTIRPAVYKKTGRCYLASDFAEDGEYYQKRYDRKDVCFWAKMRDPFSARYSFTVPDAHG